MNLNFFGYNDGIAKFINEVIQNFQQFETSREFFENIKERKIRALENVHKQEPYVRTEAKLYNLLSKYGRDSDEFLSALKDELTYEKFIEL